ncbi:hypothetical protein F8271_25155 [Micromonospora sp. ALFpr18c]|uniref:hypothetical protein n=1 Tax=Micromonospora sp. ALFpr18c TaxID=1458665 RepID=UPI00124BAFA7|nr:hypothetical protein [Micromonospora sp. ALFpr18c]KAB1932607.1 hypothetical protein F8271_25155 [Micromonospora sp. ALFpr18c]
MKEQPGDWTCNYFLLSLPAGEDQGSVPNLLRHLAQSIEKLHEGAGAEILGITYSDDEVNDYGTWPNMTVYYSPQ